MTSQEYIINGLNLLIERFPTITFNYQFDKIDNTHIISVQPLTEFEENKEYIDSESDFVYFFENKYLPETVLFVSQDSLITINEPDLIFKSNKVGLFIKDVLNTPNFNSKFDFDNIVGENIDYALAA